MELKIAPDGEICVKGPSNFSGYAKDPDATSRTIAGGWLLTGDTGRVDEDGFLYITGRKKDLIITSGGKNVAPSNLELELCGLPLVEAAIVCGEARPYLTALLTLGSAEVSGFASGSGLAASDPRSMEAVRAMLRKGIDLLNERHARFEHIRRFSILPDPFSMEDGTLTPTMKVKRAIVMRKYAALIDAMYAEPLPAVQSKPHLADNSIAG